MEPKHTKTAEAWRERVEAQQASGQSIRAWCKGHDCHEHAFYWWRSRLGLSPKSRSEGQWPRQRSGGLRFAEVVVDRRPTAEPIVLRLGGGRELVLPASMPVEHVARLVGAIEGLA